MPMPRIREENNSVTHHVIIGLSECLFILGFCNKINIVLDLETIDSGCMPKLLTLKILTIHVTKVPGPVSSSVK